MKKLKIKSKSPEEVWKVEINEKNSSNPFISEYMGRVIENYVTSGKTIRDRGTESQMESYKETDVLISSTPLSSTNNNRVTPRDSYSNERYYYSLSDYKESDLVRLKMKCESLEKELQEYQKNNSGISSESKGFKEAIDILDCISKGFNGFESMTKTMKEIYEKRYRKKF